MIGRQTELTILKELLGHHMSVLVEGSVGVGKTALIMECLKVLKKKYIRIDGDDRFTEDKLVGWFEPSKIMKKGYSKESFMPGPLVECMLEGKILFINEMNRLPEGVQNLLLPAVDEGEIQINHIGMIKAKKGFCVVGTQNPQEFVATSDLSEALKDRFEYLGLAPLSQPEMLKVLEEKIGKVKPATLDFVKSYLHFTKDNKKILNGDSLRIILALTKVFEGLEGKFESSEKAYLAATVSLKNRLAFTDSYNFELFISDWLKKKV
ncbi:MAG: AAA family ATPase [Bacteriovoracaceae bacterium]